MEGGITEGKVVCGKWSGVEAVGELRERDERACCKLKGGSHSHVQMTPLLHFCLTSVPVLAAHLAFLLKHYMIVLSRAWGLGLVEPGIVL